MLLRYMLFSHITFPAICFCPHLFIYCKADIIIKLKNQYRHLAWKEHYVEDRLGRWSVLCSMNRTDLNSGFKILRILGIYTGLTYSHISHMLLLVLITGV